ncbi:MAG: hypothetical protein AABM30_13480 [Actinomycetota bacterium]
MKRTLLAITAGLGLGLIGGSTSLGSPELTKPGPIRLTTRGLTQQFVNSGDPSRGAGDLLVIRELLYNKGITRNAIGHAELVCTYTGRLSRQCNGTFSLPKGKISVAGTLIYRQFYVLAVVGGTGFYDNVRGSLTVTLLKRKPRKDLVYFRLLI